MRTSPHIPEIEEIEERKEKLREEWRETNHGKTLAEYLTPEQNEWLEDWWLDRLDSYAQFKIDQIFKEENHRKGMSAEELETHLKNTPDEVIKALLDKEEIR